MVEVYRKRYSGCDEYVCEFDHARGLMDFIDKEAQRLNYGLYRTWVDGDRIYFDCGPITYYVDDLED